MGFPSPLFLLGLAAVPPPATVGYVSVLALWLGGGGIESADEVRYIPLWRPRRR